MTEFDRFSLPAAIPVFPLEGVLLLPGGQLPLNVFEPRYLAMVDDALRTDRLLGIIQPRNPYGDAPPLFSVGCAGRITSFEETGDGRYLIGLTGISRFRVERELEMAEKSYRCVAPDWSPFEDDRVQESCLDIDRGLLRTLLGRYFDMHQISCDWEAIDGAPDQRLITCLAMVCPLGANEKQALLEAPCCRTRASLFMTMIDMAVRQKGEGGECH